MNCDAFIKEYSDKYISDGTNRFLRFCKYVSEEISDDVFILTSKDTINRLFCKDGKAIAASSFYKEKRIIVDFYTWLYSNGLIAKPLLDYVSGVSIDDVVFDKDISGSYFKSLDDVLLYVRRVNSMAEAQGINRSDVQNILSIIILAWYGLTPVSMVELKKADVFSDGIVVNGEKIKIPEKYCLVISAYARAVKLRLFPSGIEKPLLDTPYLFRSSRSDKMNANNIFDVIKRFNQFAVSTGRIISIKDLQVNGGFERVYEAEQNDSDKPLLSLIIAECVKDKSAAYACMNLYNKWKSRYMG